MKHSHVVILSVVASLAAPAIAQHAGHRHAAHAGGAGPNAGFQGREASGVSAEEAADLRAGRGMGLALPAELNGHPGPLHALELADRMGLSVQQRAFFTAQVEAMRAETIPLGEAWIAAEMALNAVFRRATTFGGQADAEAVEAAVEASALARGRLRAAHLRVHLVTAGAMTPAQRAEYARLRGYVSAR